MWDFYVSFVIVPVDVTQFWRNPVKILCVLVYILFFLIHTCERVWSGLILSQQHAVSTTMKNCIRYWGTPNSPATSVPTRVWYSIDMRQADGTTSRTTPTIFTISTMFSVRKYFGILETPWYPQPQLVDVFFDRSKVRLYFGTTHPLTW